ncbi:hypothetical protein [Paracoccus aminovorans]|uniref:hypothetical protein n=1 Tax=Paracoccus aminovorans TaxID=34004 RepID=UPI002B259C9F|nr:hypothetical protein [Paracoccus aminovorans]
MRFMTSLIVASALMAPALPAFAALSGYWDSTKILHAILGDKRLADALKQQPIERIEKTADGYEVSSQDCMVQVKVDSILPDHPGPTRHTIRIGKGHCR